MNALGTAKPVAGKSCLKSTLIIHPKAKKVKFSSILALFIANLPI
jgi:hypothetical protein